MQNKQDIVNNKNTANKPGNVRRKAGRRWVMLGVLSLGVAFSYLDRSALSVALPYIEKDIHMSPAATGVILSGFFWSYVIFLIPLGYIGDKVGPRLTQGCASVIWGLSTAVNALSRGFLSFFGLRLVLGVAEAPLYTSGTKAIKEWFPKKERSFASGTFNNASKFGGTVATPLLAILITSIGWRLSFVVVGCIAAIWGFVWLKYYKTPRDHYSITDEELKLIESDQEEVKEDVLKELPKYAVAKLFKQKTMWCMMIGFFSVNFVSYFFFTWFPTYMINTYHLKLITFGFIGILPGIAAMIGGWIGAIICDQLYKKGYSTTASRKVPLILGLLLSCVIGLAAISHNIWFTVTILCIANGAATGAGSVVWTLPADVAPNSNMIGTIGGVQSAAGNMSGIVCPILIGVLLSISNSYAVPFIVSGIISLIGAFAYLIMPKLEPMKLH
ncbi:MFS transporter [Clostridium sp. Mt-5]|uniref:MFS transporter n=1 Tax=Clostridium moutaii TaxID=3240932 RepID=A0ABV4BU45_9CLOT